MFRFMSSSTFLQAQLGTTVCNCGGDPVICPREEAIFLKSQKCPHHVTFNLDFEHSLDAGQSGTIKWKFGGNPAVCLGEEAICANVYRQMDGQTDRQHTPHDDI